MLSDDLVRRLEESARAHYCHCYTEDAALLQEAADAIRAALAEAAQVPVMGEAVAWTSPEWLKERGKLHGMTSPHPFFKVPLYRAPAAYITQAELDALRKDAERLEFLLDECAIVNNAFGSKGPVCRLEWPHLDSWQPEWYANAGEAIDAAIASIAKERQS